MKVKTPVLEWDIMKYMKKTGRRNEQSMYGGENENHRIKKIGNCLIN